MDWWSIVTSAIGAAGGLLGMWSWWTGRGPTRDAALVPLRGALFRLTATGRKSLHVIELRADSGAVIPFNGALPTDLEPRAGGFDVAVRYIGPHDPTGPRTTSVTVISEHVRRLPFGLTRSARSAIHCPVPYRPEVDEAQRTPAMLGMPAATFREMQDRADDEERKKRRARVDSPADMTWDDVRGVDPFQGL